MARGRLVVTVLAVCAAASMGAAVYAAATIGTHTTEAGQEVVRAQRFELLDSHGRVRAVLGMTVPAVVPASFKITDSDGNEFIIPRDRIVVEGATVQGPAEAPGISLFDEAGRPRARMWLGHEGTPYLEMTKADGTVILALPSEGRVKMLAR
jgi:hypothetical protein